MKFGTELTEGLVPEWRTQYFNYKHGKKLLKKVHAAVRKTETGATSSITQKSPLNSLRDAPVYSFLQPKRGQHTPKPQASNSPNNLRLTRSRSEAQVDAIQALSSERSPLTAGSRPQNGQPEPRLRRYGSIIGSPPNETSSELSHAPTLELPTPAIDRSRPSEDSEYDRPISPNNTDGEGSIAHPPATQLAHRGNAYEVTRPIDSNASDRPFVRRFTTFATPQVSRHAQSDRDNDVALEAYRELDFRQEEFFRFLNKELKKIEKFYKEREDESEERLRKLKDQLHVLRDHRVAEIREQEARQKATSRHSHGQSTSLSVPDLSDLSVSRTHRLSVPLKASVDAARDALAKAKPGHIGKTSQAMGHLASPLGLDSGREYERQDMKSVSYTTAKRKLKTSMAELYRGLEFIQDYADLNKTAFRKITKKFDKNAVSHDGAAYKKDHVDTAHFVQSHTIGEIQQSVEDLFARYFERGDRKVATKKLRRRVYREGAFYGPTMRTGIIFGIGAVFAVQGLTYGAERLQQDPDKVLHTQTSYLLQLYAGYFLMLMLFSIFCLDAAIFANFRVNYQFVFEFDQRHMLNWKQLCEPAAWLFFWLGVCLWCNFSHWTPAAMYVYWPVLLIGVPVLVMFAPIPNFLYGRSRKWFDISVIRLLLPGAFRVEFRDFFLGDMLCSLTYALGNIELFFCLYAKHWNDPPQCNSNHSMLLGFFSTLPGIIRLLQTIRRYMESKLWTHRLNAGKYLCTILQYMSLSLWRIYRTEALLAFFIVSATANSAYCSFWDLVYDWSMPALDPWAKPHPFLRETLVFQKHLWFYYTAMALDPILRFNWIFYVIYRNEIQHSSLISFFVAFSEVIRRGIWVIIRVENEHCANVARSKAVRDMNYPYEIKPQEEDSPQERPTAPQQLDGNGAALSPSVRDVEVGEMLRSPTPAEIESPIYATLKRVGSTFRSAHAMDYERKKPENDSEKKGGDEDDDSDSE